MEAPDELNAPGRDSQERFMRLFLQSERELLRYVMAIVPHIADARDIVQEAAVALWKKFDEYDHAKPFVAWACRFALNEARQFLRKESRRSRLLSAAAAEALSQRREAIHDDLVARRQHLKDCLVRLPESQRELLQAYYFDSETVESLANRLQRTVDAIYKSLQRTRQTLLDCVASKMTASE